MAGCVTSTSASSARAPATRSSTTGSTTSSVALVEMGTFGGTCLNVGCIPSKMFVHPADLAASTIQAARLGVDLDLQGVRWREIRDRIFGRIDPKAANGRAYRYRSHNVTVFDGRARFVGPRELDVGTGRDNYRGPGGHCRGSRPMVPELPGLSSVDFHTSDTVMRLSELPQSMIIVGGGYVSAEFAHVFSAFGTASHRGEPIRCATAAGGR